MTKQKKSHHTPLVLVILLVIATLSFSGITFSRYVLEKNTDLKQATASEFYFESDQLIETNPPTYQISMGDTLTIDIRNYLDDLNVSAKSIAYDVTAQIVGGEVLTVTKKGSLALDAEGASQKIDEEIEISLSGVTGDNPTIEVIATSSSPYTKTISAYYQIATDTSTTPSFAVSDVKNSTTALIELCANGYGGTVTMTIPNGTLPNNADSRLSVASDTEFSIAVEKNAEYQIYVFKTDPTAVYKSGDFEKSVPSEVLAD